MTTSLLDRAALRAEAAAARLRAALRTMPPELAGRAGEAARGGTRYRGEDAPEYQWVVERTESLDLKDAIVRALGGLGEAERDRAATPLGSRPGVAG